MRKALPFIILAALALAAGAILTGTDPAALATALQGAPGLLLAGALPAWQTKSSGGDDDDPVMSIKQLIEAQGDAWAAFKKRNEDRVDTLEAEVRELSLKAARPGAGVFGGGASNEPTPSERKALADGMRALLSGDTARATPLLIEAKAMSAGSGPDGGYLVHTLLSGTMDRIAAEVAPLLAEVRTVPMDTGNVYEMPLDVEQAEANWVGELQTRDDTDTPGLALFRAELHELQAMPKVSQRLIDDSSFDVLEWLQSKVGEAFAVAEVAAILSGNGVAKPRGFLTYPTEAVADETRDIGKIEHVATGQSGGFASSSPADVLIDVVSRLKPQFRQNAKWYMGRDTLAATRKFKDVSGRYIWEPSAQAGMPSMLLGFPVIETEAMPAIAANSLSVAFGNLKRAYTLVRRPGVKFLPDPYSDKPNVRLYSYARRGGGVSNFQALKLVKFAAS